MMLKRSSGSTKPSLPLSGDLVLDRVGGNLMLADQDFTITYVHPQLEHLFTELESDVRKEIQGFDARSMVGRPIDMFHTSPQRIRQTLQGLRGAHQVRIELGERHVFTCTTTALDDAKGRRVGYAVQWQDITDAERHEHVQEGVAAALDAVTHADLTVRVPLDDALADDLSTARTANVVLDSLQSLMIGIKSMSAAHADGDIDARIDADQFDGSFKELVQAVNEMVAGHIAVKKKAMAVVRAIGEGDFDAPLEQFPGKKAFINETIEELRGNLKTLRLMRNPL
jgi:methyl-accepting chemotaxis protein